MSIADSWGTSAAERRHAYPCDAFVPGASAALYRSVDVDADEPTPTSSARRSTRLTRVAVDTVHAFYTEHAAKQGAAGAKTGSVSVMQRTASDLRLSPHLHLVVLDGAYAEQGAELA